MYRGARAREYLNFPLGENGHRTDAPLANPVLKSAQRDTLVTPPRMPARPPRGRLVGTCMISRGRKKKGSPRARRTDIPDGVPQPRLSDLRSSDDYIRIF